jgi:hypothetical protein
MTKQNFSLAVVNNGRMSDVVPANVRPNKVKAAAGQKYLLVQEGGHAGPEQVTVKRVGKNLVLSVPPEDEVQVVIEGYYDHPGAVQGIDGQGHYHDYVSSSDNDVEADDLENGDATAMILAPEDNKPAAVILPEPASSGFYKAAGAFAGLLGLGGLISLFHHHHRGGDADIPAPEMVSATDAVGDITGTYASGGVVNDPQPVLKGAGQAAGHLIEIYDNGVLLGTAAVGEDGGWQFTPPPLSDGEHVFTAVETEANGSRPSLPSPAFRLEVDLLPPAVTIDEVIDNVALHAGAIAREGLTNDNQPELRGSAEPGARVAVFVDGVNVGETTAGADGRWSLTLTTPLSDGEHAFTVTATDAVGNTSEMSAGYVINVDTQIEQPTIDSIADNAAGGVEGDIPRNGTGLTNDGRPVVSGSAEAGSLVVIYDGGTEIGSVYADKTTGEWSWQYAAGSSFTDGEHALRVVATDPAGNTSSASASFVINVDTQIAQPTIASIVDNAAGGVEGDIPRDGTGLTNDGRPVMSGLAEAGSLVRIYDGAVEIGSAVADVATGAWEWQYAAGSRFTDGAHGLTVTATDPAGNLSSSSTSFKINVDTQIAQPTIASIVDNAAGGVEGDIPRDGTGLTNDNRPVVSGSAESGSLIVIYDKGAAIGSVYADKTTGEWSWQYDADSKFTDGSHSLTVVATDPAGNVSTSSSSFMISVDTVIAQPTIASIVDNTAGGVEGDIPRDGTGLTNDNRPAMSGSAEAGSLVRIYDNGTEIGSVYADKTTGEWSWQYAADASFTDGSHSLTVVATDPAGNVSTSSASYVINVDTAIAQPTIASIVDNAAGGVEGDIPRDGTGLTNDNRPVMSGSAEAGSLVRIYDGAIEIGSAMADATTGAWRWQYAAGSHFTDGGHTLTVMATDPAGNVSPASANYVINVDTTIAQPSIALVEDNVPGGLEGDIPRDGTGLTNDNRPAMSGLAEAGSLVKIYDNGKEIGSTVADATTGAWRWQYAAGNNFTDGKHDLTVVATDAAGNVSASSTSFIINVDTGIAQPTIASIADNAAGGVEGDIPRDGTGLTNDNRPVMSGLAEPGSLVRIYDGAVEIGSAVADAATGMWSWQYAAGSRFTDGNHSLTVMATDPAGNVSASSASFVIHVDTQIAQPTIASIVDNAAGGVEGDIPRDGTGLTNDGRPVMSGLAEAGSLVRIYDGAVEIGSAVADAATGMWSWQYAAGSSFTDGNHSLTVVATDPAGNVSASSASFVIHVDTQISQPTITSIVDNAAGGVEGDIPRDGTGLTNDSRPVMRGLAEAGSLVRIYDGSVEIGSVYADKTTGEWTWQYAAGSNFTDDTHALTVVATDAAGNVSQKSQEFVLLVDTIPPINIQISVDSIDPAAVWDQGHNVTNDTRPQLNGSGEDGALVTIVYRDNIYTTTVVNGMWSWRPQDALKDGLQEFTVTQSDAAGNVSKPIAINFNVDTTPPSAQAKIDKIGKDSGNSQADFITNDGEAGRLIQGTLTAGLSVGDKVQISLDAGKTWQDVILSGNNWYFVDPSKHSTDWEIQTRVMDSVGNIGKVQSQVVVLDTDIPDAPKGLEVNANSIIVEFDAGKLAVGDTINIKIGDTRFDITLKDTDLEQGKVEFTIPQALKPVAEYSVSAAIVDVAGNNSQFINIPRHVIKEDFSSVTDTKVYGVGETLVLNTMSVKVLTGTTQVGTYSDTAFGTGKRLYFGYGGANTLEITPISPMQKVSFTTDYLHNPSNYKFYDQDNNIIDTVYYPANGGGFGVTYEAPEGKYIAKMIAFTDEWGFMDNFTFETPKEYSFSDSEHEQEIAGSSNGSYYGTIGNDYFLLNDVADLILNDITIRGNGGIDTLKITGASQVLDLTALGEKIQSAEIIDITGNGNNTLNLSVQDVLAQGVEDLFYTGSSVQMMVKGNEGDVVNLDDLIKDGNVSDWRAAGEVTVGGTAYQVYQHGDVEAELLVQQGVQVNLI